MLLLGRGDGIFQRYEVGRHDGGIRRPSSFLSNDICRDDASWIQQKRASPGGHEFNA